MKIRSDFVTNSSASSFVIELTVGTKHDEVSLECYTDEQEGIEIVFKGSPKEVANATSIDSMIDMILNSFEKWFDSDEEDATDCELQRIREDSFFDYLRSLDSVDDVRFVSVRGDEGGWNNVEYWCEYRYDKDTGKYTYTWHDYENDNGCSGAIYVPDEDAIDEEIESNEIGRNILLGF